jgi:hypothetical protein
MSISKRNVLHSILVSFLVAALYLQPSSLSAGTVITSNLPPNTAIINISATADGAAAFNGDQSLWYQPFNVVGPAQLLEYTVQPGTYGFRVIDPTDAARLFPALTSTQTNQIYTAWTFNSPWVTDYLVFDRAAATNSSMPQLFDGAYSNTNGSSSTWLLYGEPQSAYISAITNGFYNLLRTSATGGRDSTNNLTSYTFASTATLIFVIPDYVLGDNAGGVSVLVSPQPPILSIALGPGTNVTLLWPTNAYGYKLSQTVSLNPAAWSDVLPLPGIVGTNYLEIVPGNFGNRFFRLYHP